MNRNIKTSANHPQLYRYSEELGGTGSCQYRSTSITIENTNFEDGGNSSHFACMYGNYKDLNNLLHAIDKELNR